MTATLTEVRLADLEPGVLLGVFLDLEMPIGRTFAVLVTDPKKGEARHGHSAFGPPIREPISRLGSRPLGPEESHDEDDPGDVAWGVLTLGQELVWTNGPGRGTFCTGLTIKEIEIISPDDAGDACPTNDPPRD